MPTFELEESQYAGPIEEGLIFAAEVVQVKLKEKNYVDDDGNKVVKVEFKFAIDDPTSPHDGTNVWGETPNRFNTHPDCKLKNWAQEILATEFPAGYRLDTDVLVGHKCRIRVGARDYEKDGETKVHNYVTDVMRARDAMVEEPF